MKELTCSNGKADLWIHTIANQANARKELNPNAQKHPLLSSLYTSRIVLIMKHLERTEKNCH